MLFYLTFYSSKNQRKKYHRFQKNIKQHNSFNTDNIYKWLLKDHVTLKTGVMADENSVLHHRNKLYFKVY